jgi:hypothetical protein
MLRRNPGTFATCALTENTMHDGLIGSAAHAMLVAVPDDAIPQAARHSSVVSAAFLPNLLSTQYDAPPENGT